MRPRPEATVDDRQSRDSSVNLLSTSGRWLNDVIAQGMHSSVANRLLEAIMSPLEYLSPADGLSLPPPSIRLSHCLSRHKAHISELFPSCLGARTSRSRGAHPYPGSSGERTKGDVFQSVGVTWANPMEFCVTRRSLMRWPMVIPDSLCDAELHFRSVNDDRTWLIDEDMEVEVNSRTFALLMLVYQTVAAGLCGPIGFEHGPLRVWSDCCR
eukprot:754898-Hanusia_phi.AAC.7